MPVRLDRVDSIPNKYLKQLEGQRESFAACEYLDELLENQAIERVVQELHSYVENVGILGFHYTRAFPKPIRKAGLTVRSGEDRRMDFMRDFGHRFSEEQKGRIQRCWGQYYSPEQNLARDYRVFFTGSNNLDIVGVVHPLYTYYGGEVVNMALDQEKDNMKILSNIGKPLVIGCSLRASDLREPFYFDFGRALVSAYHRAVNNEAEWIGFSTYCNESVPPDRIDGIWEIGQGGSLTLVCT